MTRLFLLGSFASLYTLGRTLTIGERMRITLPLVAAAALLLVGCSKNTSDPMDMAGDTAGSDASRDMGSDTVIDLGRPADATFEMLRTQPGTSRLDTVRGLTIMRGIIHAHSVHSHDACDGEPVLEDGASNEPCLIDFRRAICETRQDYVFLTEHEELAAEVEFDELSLVRPGDTALMGDDGQTVAARILCENGHDALLIPGGEFGLMPVGLSNHLPGTPEERDAAYNEVTPERVESYRELGAVVLQAHTESRDREELRALGLDGFEVYQLHANVDPGIREEWLGLDPAGFLNAAVPFVQGGGGHPDLLFLTFFEPNLPSIAHFDALVADGQRLVGTGGTDCHQNVLRMSMSDGERVDSYRRMMRWFSNHLLVDDVSVDGLRNALSDGRLAIVFEVMGTPSGADFYGAARERTYEMGEYMPLDGPPILHVARPNIVDWGAANVRLEIRRSNADGTSEVVAEGSSDLEFEVTEPGAYRAVVYLTPDHLAPHLDEARQPLAEKEYQWIWFNPIYVNP